MVLLEYLSCSYAVILSEKTKPERTCNVARCPINRRQGGVWINFQNENLWTLKLVNGAIKLKIGNVWWNRPCLSQKTHLLVCLSVGLAKVDVCNILWNTIHAFGPGEGEIILSKCEKKRFIETRIPNSWCYSTMYHFLLLSNGFQRVVVALYNALNVIQDHVQIQSWIRNYNNHFLLCPITPICCLSIY